MKPIAQFLVPLFPIALVVAITGALMSAAPAATTYTWTGMTAGNWSDTTKWDGNGVPVSDVANSLVAFNPGAAVTVTSTVNSTWNTTGSGSIHSLSFNSGAITLANGVAGTNLTIGAGGITNASVNATGNGNNAIIKFDTVAGGTITTAGSQTWSTGPFATYTAARTFDFYGNLAATASTNVLTIDTGTSSSTGAMSNFTGQAVRFLGAYTTQYSGTLKMLNTAGTAGNSLYFNSARSGVWDRFASLILDNNNTSQNILLAFDGVANNNTVPTAITFQNFVATTSNRAVIAGTPGNLGNPMGTAAVVPVHLGLNLNFTGNWSGSLPAKTTNDPRNPAIAFQNGGAAMTLSGDNSALTNSGGDVVRNKTSFNSANGFLIANSANALGLNNTLGVNIGNGNANVPSGRSGLLATPAASPVRSDISVSSNQFANAGIPAQPGFASIGLRPDAANTDTVTFSGNFYGTCAYYAQNTIRLVTGLNNDATHGGRVILNGSIQDLASNYTNAGFGTNYVSPVQFLGTGIFELNGANTYAGDTSIRSGTVLVGSNAPAGYTVGASTTLPRQVDAWGGTFNVPIGSTELHLSSVAGLYVGQPFGSAIMGFQPGTVITQIGVTGDSNKVVFSLPTVAVLDNHAGPPVAAGGAFGLINTPISLGDNVPTLTTVKAASRMLNDGPSLGTGGTWSAGVYTFGTGGAPLSVDGVTLVVGDKVLVWGTTSERNGVYEVTDATHWTRTAGWDTTAAMLAKMGSRVHVTHGTINGNGGAGTDYELAPVLNTATWTLNNPVSAGSAATSAPIAFAPDVTNPNVAILTNGAFTIARPINVTNNQSTGKSSLGGNTADASTFSGLITLNKNLTVTAAASGTVTFSGDISGSNGIIKEGDGTVVFSTAKSYTGTTSVTGGTLTVNAPLASGTVAVASGGKLQGTGVLSNGVSVSGTLAPGNNDSGTLTVGSASFVSGSSLAVEINGASHDTLASTGALNLNGAALSVTLLAGGWTQSSYVIAQGSPLTGTFTSVPGGYAVDYTSTQATLRSLLTYFVSPTGSDSANGLSVATPFATIQRAANVMNAGNVCLIRGGTYRETITLPRSGTANSPITFQAYANEVVTISGSDPIPGWTLESPNIYRATTMPTGWVSLGDGNQVFQDGAMKPEARWPNIDESDGTLYPWQNSRLAHPSPYSALGDWSYVDSASYTTVASFADAQLPSHTDGYWIGARVHIMSGDGWYMWNPTVTTYTDSTRTIVTNDTNVSPGGPTPSRLAMNII